MSLVRNAAERFAEDISSLKFCANWFDLECDELHNLLANLECQCVNVLGFAVWMVEAGGCSMMMEAVGFSMAV